MSIVLVGRDKLSFFLKDFTDSLADNNAVEISPITQYGNEIVGKNENSIIYDNPSGKHCKITVRMLRGSEGDSWLSIYYSYFTLLKIFTPFYGSLERRIGDGLGNVNLEMFTMTGLFFTEPPAIASVMGTNGTEQGVVEYHLQGVVERL